MDFCTHPRDVLPSGLGALQHLRQLVKGHRHVRIEHDLSLVLGVVHGGGAAGRALAALCALCTGPRHRTGVAAVSGGIERGDKDSWRRMSMGTEEVLNSNGFMAFKKR